MAKKVDPNVEAVQWVSSEDDLPDEGITVLLFCVDASEPVWPGYFDGDSPDGYVWRTASGDVLDDVTHWAEMPSGPKG